MTMLNPWSERERLQVMLACCYASVSMTFRHLPLRYVIEPPPEYFDALLARHIAIHILATTFDVPKRRIVQLVGRSRGLVANAINNIDNRLESVVFERSYRRMSRRAWYLFHREIRNAQEAA